MGLYLYQIICVVAPFKWFAGPIPECSRIWGDAIVPALKITSPRVFATYRLLFRLNNTPYALPYLSIWTLITCASNIISKLGRFKAGFRKALAVEARFPSFILACMWVKRTLVSALISPTSCPKL